MNQQVEQRYLVNKTFDEIHVGDSASLTRTLMPEDVKLFAILTGDVNPAVVDPKFSESGMFREVIAHGMWSGSLISTVLGTQFPGPGTILVDQSLHFARPVTIGDRITITVTAKQKFEHNKHVVFDCVCTNQEGLQVVRGKAEVLAPLEKVSRLQEVHMPEIRIDDKHERYTHLLERVKGLEPIPTAVAHPCDAESLKGPVMAFQAGIIEPILVGPENKIRAVAEEFGIDLHPHRQRRAQPRFGRPGRLAGAHRRCRGADEGQPAHRRADGRSRRPRQRPAHLAPDQPRLRDGRADLPPAAADHRRGDQHRPDAGREGRHHPQRHRPRPHHRHPEPKVAILSAVETVNPKIQSTLDAAALCKMADRGQIKGGLLDGPLAFDNAVSIVAAKTKGIKSAVAGHAEILVVPDLESGNMVAKQLEYLANALTAGIVLGTKVPIVLTSRADSAETRTASCVIAALIAHANRKNGTT
jgi:phosphate acetyltransferase